MLEYTFDEAKDLLSSKCETAKTSLKNTIEDLEFLRDQITTMEVSKYQCFGWMVFHWISSVDHVLYRHCTSIQLGCQATTTSKGTRSKIVLL